MYKVTVVIPNFNGSTFVKDCFDSLEKQSFRDFHTVMVDNGSEDGSREFVAEHYPWVEIISLGENTGFCHAVNVGIQATDSPYVLLLNNDTQVDPDFVLELYEGIEKRPKAFSCAAKMIKLHDRTKMDDAGNYYNALGWAFARGKDKAQEYYKKPCRIFASCAGAAIYRRAYLDETGLFDEEHFAYLEDMDIGYRANILGYENWFLPDAIVYHAGSGTSGSRYNLFKIRYSSRNNIYLIYKNMPWLQILLNLPFLIAGFGIKILFFAKKGYGREYLAGIKNGCSISAKTSNRKKKVAFQGKNIKNYIYIQLQLWLNVLRRFL